ncbi:hypothetical protein LIER_01847 [Lithospermum erythrorhizon]|uniref:Uncharacterized protein n=1 Tax=Lithospermum erythrorhizon TaxID=34254 RepID=A0AAV3NS45_LITER
MNVQEIDNPRPSRVNMDNDDVAREKSHDEIEAEENVIGQEVAPIVEEKVNDSSRGEMSNIVDMTYPPANLSVEDTTGNTVESHFVSEASTGDIGENVLEGDGVSQVDTVNGRGDLLRPSVDDSIKDTVAEGMDADIPSVFDMELVTDKSDLEDDGPKKKSKKRKHKKSANAGESSEAKRKLSKEERKAKRARRAERIARRAADADDDVHEEAEDHEQEQEVPYVVQPTADDEWLPEHEPQGDNADEEAQDVITKRRKTTSKLKLNENRTKVGNKRVPKNVAEVSTANVALNYEEEQAKWSKSHAVS